MTFLCLFSGIRTLWLTCVVGRFCSALHSIAFSEIAKSASTPSQEGRCWQRCVFRLVCLHSCFSSCGSPLVCLHSRESIVTGIARPRTHAGGEPGASNAQVGTSARGKCDAALERTAAAACRAPADMMLRKRRSLRKEGGGARMTRRRRREV